MRKILLASVATMAATGVAMAATTSSTSTQIQAFVTASCDTPSSSTTVDFGTDPVAGNTKTGTVTIKCNFAGNNGGALKVNFSSAEGGIKNGSSLKTYSLDFGTSLTTSSTTLKTVGLAAPTSLAAANVAEPQTYTLTLTQTPDVAGSYSDTLSMTVSY